MSQLELQDPSIIPAMHVADKAMSAATAGPGCVRKKSGPCGAWLEEAYMRVMVSQSAQKPAAAKIQAQ